MSEKEMFKDCMWYVTQYLLPDVIPANPIHKCELWKNEKLQDVGNYFKTREDAENVCNAIRTLLKLPLLDRPMFY
ncbi:hypothetical protein AGMMS4957_19650 [Bacteroidia bacterium]|nr:hypothetical protein AGMMS4957_19650 [Bacteroidia bacterium]